MSRCRYKIKQRLAEVWRSSNSVKRCNLIFWFPVSSRNAEDLVLVVNRVDATAQDKIKWTLSNVLGFSETKGKVAAFM